VCALERESAQPDRLIALRPSAGPVETDKEMVDYILSFAGDVAHRPYKYILAPRLMSAPRAAN
jgi:hypothetical protein